MQRQDLGIQRATVFWRCQHCAAEAPIDVDQPFAPQLRAIDAGHACPRGESPFGSQS